LFNSTGQDVYYCGDDSFPRRAQHTQGGLIRPKPSKLSISVDTQGPPRERKCIVYLFDKFKVIYICRYSRPTKRA